MKGNPWENVSSQFPPPPKPPTARNRPSAGAQRYSNFKPPPETAYTSTQDSRTNAFHAFERMRHTGTGKAPPQPPPRATPQYRQEDRYARAQAQTNARPAPGFDEYREPNTSPRRSQSSNAANRKGFQPNTPGGDEPPAPRGAYATKRDKPTAPPPPPRQPAFATTSSVQPDPLEQFRKDELPSMEPRSSQPYTTHGGEKFSPYEANPNIGRSKSTREGSGRFDDGYVPRTGSDSTLNTPQRARSSAQRPYSTAKPTFQSSRVDSSSSDDLPEMKAPRSNPSMNKNNGATSRNTQPADASRRAETTRKHSKISQMRQWMDENPGQEPPPDGFPPDGPPLRNGQANSATDTTNLNDTNANNTTFNNGVNSQPSMYASSAHSSFTYEKVHSSPFSSYQGYATTQNIPQKDSMNQREKKPKYFEIISESTPGQSEVPTRSPSGLVPDLQGLSPFEREQRDIVDRLLSFKRTSGWAQKSSDSPTKAPLCQANDHTEEWSSHNTPNCDESRSRYEEAIGFGNPSKKPNSFIEPPITSPGRACMFWNSMQEMKKSANNLAHSRFTFSAYNETFSPTQPQANAFSSSENISTKFTPEDWDGKFEAGDYFQPTTGPSPSRPRTQSTSRSRGRSPPKTRPTIDPKFMPATEPETTIESPGGTKFSADEWKETFKPQTFMPPNNPSVTPRPQPGRKRTVPVLRTPVGGRAPATTDDENDSTDGNPLFANRRASSPQAIVPDPMDVDTPPAARTVPQFTPSQPSAKPNLNADPLKRAAVSVPVSPTDEAELKVTFADLNLGTFMSSLNMPSPTAPPRLPNLSESDSLSRDAFETYIGRFTTYMNSWDDVNTKFLLHMASRKTQNLGLKDMRWTDEQAMDIYRTGLKEDRLVLARWNELTEKHEKIVMECAIMKERMKAVEQEKDRPRKKVH
jgi:hypothetical protein